MATKETYNVQVEYTDTFGGSANYSWVRRETLTVPTTITNSALMRRAKKVVGLTNVRGSTYTDGDYVEFRPYRFCTIMFVTTVY